MTTPAERPDTEFDYIEAAIEDAFGARDAALPEKFRTSQIAAWAQYDALRTSLAEAEARAAHWEMHYKTKTHLARREALEEAAQIAFDYNGRSPSDGRCIADRIRIRALAEKESK